MKLKEKKEQVLNSNIDSEKNQNKDLSARYNELSQKYEDVCRGNKNLKESYRLSSVSNKNMGEIKASKEL